MFTYDAGYKRIFSQREFIVDLIKYFIDEPSLKKDVDLSSLEKVNHSFVTRKLRKKESDIIWKLKSSEGDLYLYFLIEFQSTIDEFMAIRLMSYLGLFYEDLSGSKELNHLPPVIPWVIYNGEKPWTAALNPQELLHPKTPQGLKPFCPSFRYHLLDMGHYPLKKPLEGSFSNIVLPLIAFEQSTKNRKDARELIKYFFERLSGTQHKELVKAFATYITHVLELKRLPEDKELWERPEEVSRMLYERIKQSDEMARQECRHLTLVETLDVLLPQRFNTVPNNFHNVLENADTETLEKCIKNLFLANSFEELAKQIGLSFIVSNKKNKKK